MKEEEKRANYETLMETIKARLELVQLLMQGGMNLLLQPKSAEEFCWLNLRMIGETIAIACLLAHDDLQDKKLLSTWEADKIIKTLGNLHGDFFPRPVRKPQFSNENGKINMNAAPAGFLDRDELLSLIGLAGNKLHVGSLKSLLKENKPSQNSFSEIQAWSNKIVLLLQEHYIKFKNGSVYYINLQEASKNNRVYAVLATPDIPEIPS